MLRKTFWSLPTVLLALLVCPLHAATYGVGSCNAKLKSFSTIQAAVSTVPSGSIIQICPGTYYEQVTINQPLTLEAVTFNNSNRVTIALPPNTTLSPNVGSILGVPPGLVSQYLYAQVLVASVAPAGPVNITGITVDGTGGNRNCNGSDGLVGIFYSVNTTGTVNEVTTRNQQHCGYGYGIWGENTAGTTGDFTVENSSVENTDDNAIVTGSDQSPSTINASIKGNFINLPNTAAAFSVGVRGLVAGGTITNNVMTGGRSAVLIAPLAAQPQCCAMTISTNTMADIALGTTGAAIQMGLGSTATSNQIFNVYTGILTSSAATFRSNTMMNVTQGAGVAIGCEPGVVNGKNVFNDVAIGYDQPETPMTGDTLYNVDTIQLSPCS